MLMGNLKPSKSQDEYCQEKDGRFQTLIVLMGYQSYFPKNLSKTSGSRSGAQVFGFSRDRISPIEKLPPNLHTVFEYS